MSQQTTKKRIFLTGSYGMGNTGDEAILQSILHQLRSRISEADITVVAGNPQAIQAQFGVQTVRWDSWLDIIAAIKQADLIIQGGGGLFFDYGGLSFESLLKDAAPDLAHFGSYSLLSKLYNKPFMIYACGVGPLFTEEGRELTKVVFSLADRATVRDEESRAVLEAIGVQTSGVQVTADPAFSMPIADAERVKTILAQHNIDLDKPLIAVTPRPWDFEISQDVWETQLAQEISVFAQEKQAQILLIPFHQGYDDSAVKSLQEKLSGNTVHVLEGSFTGSELAGIIGQCDLLVGMRLHSVLFAILTGTPAVALAYDPKVRNLMRRVGYEALCLDLNELGNLSSKLLDAWSQSAKIRANFLHIAHEFRTQSETNADYVWELLESNFVKHNIPLDRTFLKIIAQIIESRLGEIRVQQKNSQNRIQSLEQTIQNHEQTIQSLEQTIQNHEQTIQSLNAELLAIYNSRGWQIILIYRRIRALLKNFMKINGVGA